MLAFVAAAEKASELVVVSVAVVEVLTANVVLNGLTQVRTHHMALGEAPPPPHQG